MKLDRDALRAADISPWRLRRTDLYQTTRFLYLDLVRFWRFKDYRGKRQLKTSYRHTVGLRRSVRNRRDRVLSH